MRVVQGSGALEKPLEHGVLTIGNFDGLHVGHRSIMGTVIERARSVRGEAAVFTFEPHPRKLLYPDRAPRLLTTLEQKLELLDEIGVDLVIVEPFTRDLATLPAERFVREVVFQRIAPVEVYVGYDFHYGSYVLRGWKAVIADLRDPRFIEARDRMSNLYSYVWSPGPLSVTFPAAESMPPGPLRSPPNTICPSPS